MSSQKSTPKAAKAVQQNGKDDKATEKGNSAKQWIRGLVGNALSIGMLFGIAAPLGLQEYALVALGIQVGVFAIHGYPQSSEKYYDASGSLTHFAVVILSLIRSEGRSKRQILLGICSVVWMTRLGSFLFTRIMKDGKDGRFDALKKNILRFLAAFTIQALWVFLIQLPVLIVNSQEVDAGGSALGALDAVGFATFAFGFLFEVIADAEKTAFRGNPDNKDKFITTGLWARSRHPNYFGEIVMWTGIAIASTASFSSPVQYLGWLSPIFTVLLLTKVSGVPMLEHRGKKKWGHIPEYQAYMKNTPCIIPRT